MTDTRSTGISGIFAAATPAIDSVANDLPRGGYRDASTAQSRLCRCPGLERAIKEALLGQWPVQ